jgi:hypothetical protein
MPYPVSFEADYVEQRSRLRAFFRGLMLFPLYIWVAFYGLAAYFAVVFAWFAIVFTGRYPEGLYGFVSGFVRVLGLTTAYGALLTDQYPAFGPTPVAGYPVRIEFAGPLPQYSRLKTFFRSIIAIPIYILRYALNFLVAICQFAALVVAVITGRMPRGLFDTLYTLNAYIVRSDCYLLLLTETYPPFSSEPAPAAPGLA